MDVAADVNGSRSDAGPTFTKHCVEGPFTLSTGTGRSVDERLDSILEMIRTWDWRSAIPVEERAAPRVPPVPHQPAPPPFEFTGASRLAHLPPLTVPGPSVDSPLSETTWRPLPYDPPAIRVDDASPTMTPPSHRIEPPIDLAPPAGVNGSPATTLDPIAEPETEPDELEIPPSTARRVAKSLLWLIPVVVVVGLVAIITTHNPGETSGSLTPTTVTPSGGAHAATIPVSPTVLAQFNSVSKPLNAANTTVTHALASSSSSQSFTQVAAEVAPYGTALSAFAFEFQSISWPATMQAPSHDLTLRTQALIRFLPSISSASFDTLNAWFTQFHVLAANVQTADNLIRRDIGLPATNSYP